MNKSWFHLLTCLILFLCGFRFSSPVAVVIRDIVPGVSSSGVEALTAYKSNVFFVASTSLGKELWQSDGTESGTNLVRDIYSGSGDSWPQNLFYYKEWLYFTADSGTGSGRELWKTDGIPHRTFMVADIMSGSGSSEPRDFIIYNNADGGFLIQEMVKAKIDYK